MRTMITIALLTLAFPGSIACLGQTGDSAADRSPRDESRAESAAMIEPFRLDLGMMSEDDAGASAPSNGWRVDAYAWIWLVGMDGDVGEQGQTAEVDALFTDIVDKSDSIFALSGRIEVGKGKWTLFADGIYSNLGVDDQTGPEGQDDIDVTIETMLVDFGLMYRVGEWEPNNASAAANHRDVALDLYGGGRYTNLDVELDPAAASAVSSDIDWLDPIVGARLILPIAEKWHLMAMGDVGGFGVESDFTWSATGVIGFDFTMFDCPSAVYGGYRAIGQDFSEGSGTNQFEWDIIQHGPILGLSISF